jgi:hypothetical protein
VETFVIIFIGAMFFLGGSFAFFTKEVNIEGQPHPLQGLPAQLFGACAALVGIGLIFYGLSQLD